MMGLFLLVAVIWGRKVNGQYTSDVKLIILVLTILTAVEYIGWEISKRNNK